MNLSTRREIRRRCAWNLQQQGRKQQQIAHALGVTQGAVSQWLKRAKDEGTNALQTRTPPGRAARLTPAQKAQIPALLSQGAQAFGFRGDLWTRARIGQVLEKEFGVTYHPGHVGRLLKALGWSRQEPVRRATQRNEGAIAHWQTQHWPALKKSAREKGALPSL